MGIIPSRNLEDQRREVNGITYFDRGTLQGRNGRRYDRFAIQTHFVQRDESHSGIGDNHAVCGLVHADFTLSGKDVGKKAVLHQHFICRLIEIDASRRVDGKNLNVGCLADFLQLDQKSAVC